MAVSFRDPPEVSRPTGYSHVALVESGRQIHLSGQVAMNAAGEIVGKGDIAAQAEQVYANLAACLASAGAGFGDVFKMVTYVVDLTPEKTAAIRAVRRRRFGDGPFPASTLVGVSALVHPDLLVEVEMIAHWPQASG
jgi:enamine deaminase RidA (YjgF/YER057c/UK114 family)